MTIATPIAAASNADSARPSSRPGSGAERAPGGPASAPALTQALRRLNASRQRLHAQWVAPETAGHPPSELPSARGGLSSVWRWLRQQLVRTPGMNALADVAGTWWRAHPWHDAATSVAREVGPHALTWVRRHPILAVALAAGAGYATVRLQPWRSEWTRRQLGALPHHVGRVAWELAAQVPLQTWLVGLVGAAVTDAPAPSPPSAQTPAPPA